MVFVYQNRQDRTARESKAGQRAQSSAHSHAVLWSFRGLAGVSVTAGGGGGISGANEVSRAHIKQKSSLIGGKRIIPEKIGGISCFISLA